MDKISYDLYKTGPFKKLPHEIREAINKNIIPLNIKNINYFNDDMCKDFIKNNFKSDVLNAYNILIPSAYKADLWRFCVLYINGGIYGDLTQHFIKNFDINEKNPDMIFVKDRPINSIQISFIATIKNNPFIKYIIDNLVEKILKHDKGKSHLDVTGPITIGTYFLSYFKNSKIELGFYEYEGLDNNIYKVYIPFKHLNTNNITDKNNNIYINLYIKNHRKLLYNKNNKRYHILWDKNNVFYDSIKGTWNKTSRNIKYLDKNKLTCELKNKKGKWIKNKLIFNFGEKYENINGKFILQT
jgi:mannosyltransferase OCH1-like enzyme